MKNIYCCGCKTTIFAKKISGQEVYNHRSDLYNLVFWACPECNLFVGSNKETHEPLGVIPTKEMKTLRMQIHSILDPLWKDKKIKRGRLYARMSGKLKTQFHTSWLRTIEEHQKALEIANWLREEVLKEANNL